MDAMRFYRIGSWCLRHKVPVVPSFMKGLTFLLCSAVVPPSATIGARARFGYRGLGVIVHPRAVIGDGTLVGPHVTIGGRSGHQEVPVIGSRVFLGVGARILGPVKIGDGAVIGANAVVVGDVPARALAVGVPAKVVRTDINVDDYVTMPS